MQLVFEFGAKEVEPVAQAIRGAMGNTHYRTSCLSVDSDTYSPTEDSLASATLKLKEGAIASFSLHPQNGLIRYAMATCPFFDGQKLSLYMGTIEYLGNDYRDLWSLLLGIPRITLACVGFEEGVEIEEDILHEHTFPWNEWPLVVAALRDDSGSSNSWKIREGPEIKWFTKVS